ncbi:metallophosphoesterase [Weizmannia acidilactici]|uniref:Metallophosphoesterase n=2 Tax=Heyndrickxia TaxID=2837504 RepID=A0A5J4J7V5_9BACI|nr:MULTISPECIES: DNA repair exonuclease [Heyndrickxia]MDL5042159.1 DNA repair exonuclease [Heyndrickxia coagulans]MDT9756867.1 DNA repair exonuclease [Heyndrickxia coagulans]GER68315.1 metallophosphoesterase [Weizmannia acidilactici]GER70986.1 metallophosphoesterase [Weizmannia acidilactici]GER74604.1 metallophosphoesterase [Weizmannia acidilactici]
MSFSFIHTADIHLDSPLVGLEQYEGAPVEKIRGATREAFKNLVDTAIKRHVDFIVIAGDLYDGDWKDYNTGLFFTSQMVRLQKEGIRVFLIRGNHDAANIMTKVLKLPDNVYEFPIKAPGTVTLDELGVAIHGQGFASRAVGENLVKLYPPKKEGYFNIGILHTSATGREGHENYAPCTIEDMKEKQYDYWALGHIHLRELLHPYDPVILFPGNIQGRHIRETGEKGCTYVEVKDGAIEKMEQIPLDVLRWELCAIDAGGMETVDELLDAAREALERKYEEADGRYLAVRFKFFGATKIHRELIAKKDLVLNQLRSVSLEAGFGEIWVEKVKIETAGLNDSGAFISEQSPVGMILKFMREAAEDEEMLQSLLDEFRDIRQAIPHELKEGEDGFDFSDPGLIKKRLKDVEDFILYSLMETGVGA